MEENGWTLVWKYARPETEIDWPVVGGYVVHGNELILHPPNYDDDHCKQMEIDSAPCGIEWSIMHMEGMIRSTDHQVVTLLIGQGINIEVTREVQSSVNLIVLITY